VLYFRIILIFLEVLVKFLIPGGPFSDVTETRLL
jgi:hypothetical protein